MLNSVEKRLIKQYGTVLGSTALLLLLIYIFFYFFVQTSNDILEENNLDITTFTQQEEGETIPETRISEVYSSPYKDMQKHIANNTLEKEAQGTAVYEIEYMVVWSRDTHPTKYPFGASSTLLVWSHATQENELYTEKGEASSALETFVETRNTNRITRTLEALKETKNIEKYSIERNISAPNIYKTQLSIKKDSPYISIIAPLSPSPDWMVAAHSPTLYNEGDGWIQSIELPLTTFDLGTDSGETFTSGNRNTPAGEERIILQKRDISPEIGSVRITLLGEK